MPDLTDTDVVLSEDRVIWRDELTTVLRKSSETIRRWINDGTLPPADVPINRRTMGWRISTLRAHGINLP